MGERFRIVRQLGAGGMGEVFAAHDDVLGADIALKMLKPELAHSSVALERFRREIALARRVTDPHVCRMFDVGELDGRVFLTMELLDGKPLAGPVSIDELDRIAPQLVAGLAALHAAGIVHRDFKTGNVMMVDDRAVITDFGLARSIDQEPDLTIDGGLLGTPAYMAPEQVEGRTATFASDVYALGVVLFELATGRLPFGGDTALANATARLTQDAPRPSSLRPELPAKWDEIIARCLARDPAARPALGDVLATRRSRRWILGAAGLAIAGAAGGGAWLLRPTAPTLAKDALVAVLGVEGTGRLVEDPLRLALTVDIHDQLTTSAIPMVHLYQGGMTEVFGGRAAELLEQPDPSAAAFANPRVTHVVRMKLVASDPITVEVSIVARGAKPSSTVLTRPETEATRLVDDIAHEVARRLGARAPRRAGDTAAYAPGLYTRYGAALARLWAEDEDWAPLAKLVEDTPDLARAAARLANRAVAEGEQMQGERVLRVLDRASALLDRALARDPELALAIATRGAIAMLRWDWQSTDRLTRRARELAPTHERVKFHRGMFLMLTGRFEEFLRQVREEVEVNPPPRKLVIMTANLNNARRFQEAVEQGRAIEHQVTNPGLKLWLFVELAHAYGEIARYPEAIEMADRVMAMPERDKHTQLVARLTRTYALAGRRDRALDVKAEVYDKAATMSQASIDDALGDIDSALAKLEAVVDGRGLQACFLKMRRFSPQLRSHPRFQALLKRVGLE